MSHIGKTGDDKCMCGEWKFSHDNYCPHCELNIRHIKKQSLKLITFIVLSMFFAGIYLRTML
jgi:hypothetical protein